ncbi:MAG TPA: bifunctional riboflavin kinase/FAD synthetase [Gemmatimonadaceae bacterium]|nr:bifunctional riboflavin kinase/FAD synthetase [Gemmatimonadaceae bacterium]
MTTAVSGLPPNVTKTAVTVGTFDGVHRGHLDVILRLIARAHANGVRSVAITFEPHPLEVVNPAAAPQLLTVGDEKMEVLAESGLDYLVVLPFTPALAALPAESFVDDVLRARFRMCDLLIGHVHGFGRQRAGNPAILKALGTSRGFSVEVIEPVSDTGGRWVSSTAIRRAIAGGDLASAEQMLGRPYSVGGTVIKGEQRGRALGFPTINLSPPPARKLLPPDGVYAARVQTPRGPFGAMVHLGPRPTFGDQARSIEAYLFDTEGDFYDLRVRIDLLERLRDIRKFDTPAALVEQIRADEVAARAALLTHPLSGIPLRASVL